MSTQDPLQSPRAAANRVQHLEHALAHAAHYLPAQGPIGVFVHHNTLHAFQHLPFHDAVAQAMDVLDVDGYLTEDAFEGHVRTGRIDPADIDFALASHRRMHAGDAIDPGVERLIVTHRIRALDREAVLYRASEFGWASLLHDDLSEGARFDAARRARDEIRAAVAHLGTTLTPGDLALLLAPSWAVPKAPKTSRAPARGAVAALTALGLPDDHVRDCVALARRREGARAEEVLVGEVDRLRAVLNVLGVERGTLGGLFARLEDAPEEFAASTLLAACAGLRGGASEGAHASLLARLGRDRTPRDLFVALGAEDPALEVNRVLIRLVGAYLDEGLSRTAMPDRHRGLWATFLDRMRRMRVRPAWQATLLARLPEGEASAAEVVIAALDQLGVEEGDWATFLRRLLLALPGWSGMVSHLERTPKSRPPGGPPASLLELTAARLCLDLSSWDHAARVVLGHRGPLRELATVARRARPEPEDEGSLPHEDAWGLFHVCQHLGVSASTLRATPRDRRELWLDTLRRTRGLVRRRILHEAFERHYYAPLLDALTANRARGLSDLTSARVQVVCCIDDREESLVRAMEEYAPWIDVRNTAGFFGVPMYYRGLDDPSFAPQCPAPVTPVNEVVEVPHPDERGRALVRAGRRTLLGWLELGVFRASRQLLLGALLTPVLGALALPAMLLRIARPRWAASAGHFLLRALEKPKTELETRSEDGAQLGETGARIGLSLAEKVSRVQTLLENIHLERGFGDLVLLLGHGSSSMNNPHESAHDCGACGGRHGGPNARLFAQLANDGAVRAALRERGIDIPEGTVFVGGQHDTATDEVHLYDEELARARQPETLAELSLVLERARRLSAHERCRRFDAAPRDPSPESALRHVQSRSEDLSQVRPEYGHCTKAAAIVGRRVLSRGVFLDRRVLLVSYDPAGDDGSILERTLAAVGPVGAGINLEYYFSSVDPDRLGCGTKLPHNLAGFLGVMEGSESDLRTGLPRQMTEVHEPVRLLLICETTPEILLGICERQPAVRELVVNDWVELVALDPKTGALLRYENGTFIPHVPSEDAIETVPHSRDWYRGEKGYLPPALIARSTRSIMPPRPDDSAGEAAHV